MMLVGELLRAWATAASERPAGEKPALGPNSRFWERSCNQHVTATVLGTSPGIVDVRAMYLLKKEFALADARSVDHFENIASRKCPAISYQGNRS